jgi:hypothetical protein
MEPPGEEDRGAQEGAPREELYVGLGDTINTTGSGSSRAGSIFTTFDTLPFLSPFWELKYQK